MQKLMILSGGIDRISNALGSMCDWLLLFSVLISSGNAAIRYLFSVSSNGWLEIQWYMFGAIVFLGASKTLRKNEHVRVDLLYASLSRNARLWVDIVGFVIFFLPAIFCLFMLSLPFFANSFTSAESSSNAGGLLLWPIKLVLPVGFGLLLLQGISELIKRIAALDGAGDFDPSYQKPLQ